MSPAEREEYERERQRLYAQYQDVVKRMKAEGLPEINDETIAAYWRKQIIDYKTIEKQLSVERLGKLDATADGTLPYRKWDAQRRRVLERAKQLWPDGYAPGRKIPPRNPAAPPKDWSKDAPPINAKRWNHILYGDIESGGHKAGYGWINPMKDGSERSEFPRAWSRADIAEALEYTLRNGQQVEVQARIEYYSVLEEVKLKLMLSKSRIITFHPIG